MNTENINSENSKSPILDVRQCSISWWNELGNNPLLRMIKQGELTTKYYGQMRKTSSLTGREIENIYVSENVT
jgi:hypothetical protein